MNRLNRRELLRDGARALVFTGLLATGAILGTRDRSGRDATCLIDLPCRECASLSGCSDPKVTRYLREQNRAATAKERRMFPLPDGSGSEPGATRSTRGSR